MADTPTQSWKPGQSVIRWAWASIISLAAGAWIGGIFVFIQQTITIAALAASLPIFFLTLMRLWLEIGRDNEIPPAVRSQIRRNIVVFGPVAILQLLLFVYFPKSNFSGLQKESD